jgi:NAD+ dependent glucose-6-phosphate dehydrogenase
VESQIVKILITGGCGKCGTALVALPYEKVFFDRLPCVNELSGEHFVRGEIGSLDVLAEAVQCCDTIIHLAASTNLESSWEEVLQDNIEGTRNVLKVACDRGVERFIFASTNHVVGMYELEGAPDIYEIGHGIVINRDTPVRPDSYYGVSKSFGESLGRYLAENGGPRFYAIRIGAVLGAENDHPYAYAEDGVKRGLWENNSQQYRLLEKRLKAIWQSRRDFVQMVDRCLQYNGGVFEIFFGVSDNLRRWLDIEYAKEVLGYQPRDSAEEWTCPPGAGSLEK